MAEQRYQAVLAVIADGRSVTEVAAQWRVSRQTLHAWLARYEAEGLEGLADRSHRPVACPHQMPAPLEARVLEMAAAALPERSPCPVQVIQNERGEVLDVDLSACQGSEARRTRLALAMHRASPLPMPPAGLASGSSLTLDLSQY